MEHTRISPAERVSAPLLLPGAVAPLPAVTRILARFERQQVEGFIELAIALLDTLDGDCELEQTFTEDDFCNFPADGPGCPVSDAGELDGDETDGNGAEDEPCGWFLTFHEAPGCPVADAGGEDATI